MRKHVLFFVHGMGAYVNDKGEPDNTWFDDAKNALKEQYDKYPFVKYKPFEDTFELVYINYDTEIFKLVKRWQDESEKMLATAIPAAPEKKLVGWLNNAAQLDNNFAWSHAACVILYRYFPLMRQRIKIHVATQFHKALAPNSDGAVSTWSVIAHSLGTIVTHDVLWAMDSSTPVQAGISVLDAMVPSANVIAMLANVSKVLETDAKVYESVVVPQSMVQNQSACYNYLNYNNEFDPFVLPAPFDPLAPDVTPRVREPWALAKANGTYLDISIRNVHEVNVHSIRNYLVNPAVHIPLLEKLVGVGSITKREKDAAQEQFENVPTAKIKRQFDKIQTDLRQELKRESKESVWFTRVGKFFARCNQVS